MPPEQLEEVRAWLAKASRDLQAERMENLVKLADLRGVPLTNPVTELGTEPSLVV